MPGRIYEATWGRAFAAVYDHVLEASERAGLRDERRRVLADARGATLEIGAGTGLNLDLYPDAVTELVLTEPSEHMASRLRERAAGHSGVEVVSAPADRLPFQDDRFDTVVCTLVLCTIPDPAGALREIRRVLRPSGQLLFLEHVRSAEPGLARWQDRLEPVWRFMAAGCRCNRDTRAAIEAAGLEIGDLRSGQIPKAAPLVRPMISGSATRP